MDPFSSEAEPSDYSVAPIYLSLSYILLVVALALVLTRCFVRLRISRDWGCDDVTIIVAFLCLIACAIIVQIQSMMGVGKHLAYLMASEPPEKILQILRTVVVYQIFTCACTVFTKISISLYILRIRNSSRIRLVLLVMMIVQTLVSLAAVIVFSLSCIPLQKLWIPSTPGICIPLKHIFIVGYVHSALTILIDFCLSLTPIVILWNVKIDLRRKLFVCILMSLGLGATVSNGLRNHYQQEEATADFTYNILGVTVCVILETSLGVIAACVPTCVPFVRWLKSPKRVLSQSSLGLRSGDVHQIVKTTDVHLFEVEVGAEPVETDLYDGKSHVRQERIQNLRFMEKSDCTFEIDLSHIGDSSRTSSRIWEG